MADAEDRPLSREETQELRAHVDRDRTRVVELTREVGRSRRQPMSQFVPDITGQPGMARQHSEWTRERTRGLEMLSRDLFFAKVETRVSTSREKNTPLCLLMSKARGVGHLDHDNGWAVVSWTDPLVRLVDQRPGERAEIPVPNRSPASYAIDAIGRFDSLSPKLTGIQYSLDLGDFFLTSEDDLALPEIAVPALPPPIEYKVAEVIGLGDIIATADGLQRAAMHLPFKANILIEGPPGSGKTSVGLMRIACLIDQQWESLSLDRAKDRAFHEQATMRVLVFNEEMVDYLRTLVQSTGVQGVRVQTTRSFTLGLCRAAGTLSGRLARDKASVAAVKSHREMLAAYWAGFRKTLANAWHGRGADLESALSKIGAEGGQAFKVVADWAERVLEAPMPTGAAAGLNIAEPLARWRRGLERSIPEPEELPPMPRNVSRQQADRMLADRDRVRASNEAARQRKAESEGVVRDVKTLVGAFLHEAMNRRAIARVMFETPEFAALLGAARRSGVPEARVARAQRWWRDQYEGEDPVYSEYDAVAAAWLGLHTMLVPSSGPRPLVGGIAEQLTHIVIDEAQDLSPAHLTLISSVLHADGNLTVLGDVRQNLNPIGGLRHWGELGFPVERRAFDVNYRQSAELGRFVQGLHHLLYSEEPVWRPTDRWHGPLPAIASVNSWKVLVEAVANQCRRAKELVPGCTVAVLYDKRVRPKRLDWLRSELDTRLADLLPNVQLVDPKSRGAQLRDTDAIVIASVQQTKGLEFDAVVFVDPEARWSGAAGELPLRQRNGLYVAASRARQFLAMMMGGRPMDGLSELASCGLCEIDDTDRGE